MAAESKLLLWRSSERGRPPSQSVAVAPPLVCNAPPSMPGTTDDVTADDEAKACTKRCIEEAPATETSGGDKPIGGDR